MSHFTSIQLNCSSLYRCFFPPLVWKLEYLTTKTIKWRLFYSPHPPSYIEHNHYHYHIIGHKHASSNQIIFRHCGHFISVPSTSVDQQYAITIWFFPLCCNCHVACYQPTNFLFSRTMNHSISQDAHDDDNNQAKWHEHGQCDTNQILSSDSKCQSHNEICLRHVFLLHFSTRTKFKSFQVQEIVSVLALPPSMYSAFSHQNVEKIFFFFLKKNCFRLMVTIRNPWWWRLQIFRLLY